MTRLTTTSWLVSLLLSTIPAPANSDCQDEDFAFPGVTATAIPLRFRNAVLRIESGGSRGSGFVIDADRGLVLTAAHVVRGASLSQDRIIAHSTASSEPLRLALRADLFEEAVDLALLQVENLETLDQVIPVDVMTDVPRGMPEGVVLGYPWADTFAETSIEMVRVHLSGGQPTFEHQGVVFRSLLSASTQTEDGISGGPLVALGGAAVAVAVATKGAKTYFSSLSELPRLLSKVELSEEMQDLDSQLQKGEVLPEELVRRMKPEQSNDSFRNIDLIRWGLGVGRDVGRYQRSLEHFRCPIQYAFSDRRISGVAHEFGGLIDVTAHAAARIERALAMALLHRQSEALQELRATDQVLTTSAVSDASTKELLADVEMARRSVQNNVESLPPPGQWQRPFFASHSRPGRTETPAPAPPEERIVLRGVNFDFDSSGLRPDAAVILGEVAEILRENPRRSVTVAGHTDSIGADTYNQALSERRAMAVKEYLVRAGVPSETLNAVGYGESQPIASNDTAEGRALSRRVELNLD